jgi:hypothetical protein
VTASALLLPASCVAWPKRYFPIKPCMRRNQSRWRDQRIIKTWGVFCGRPGTIWS